MFRKGMNKRFIAFSMACAMLFGGVGAPTADAKNNTTAVVKTDKYRKTLTNGFLGRSYGTVIDGVSCDCSGYTKVVLSRMESKTTGSNSFKKVTVKPRSTMEWLAGSKVTYTTGVATKGAVSWKKQTSVRVGGKKNSEGTKLSKLDLGEVILYGNSGNSTSHIAVYFGKFDSASDVRDYLVKIGVYKSGELKAQAGGRYTCKGKTIIRGYTDSSYWRIHSTNGGIMIDNDIANQSGYTGSFGKWRWTFDSGIVSK